MPQEFYSYAYNGIVLDELRLVKDRKFGNVTPGGWNGLVGEIIRKVSSIQISQLL